MFSKDLYIEPLLGNVLYFKVDTLASFDRRLASEHHKQSRIDGGENQGVEAG